MTDDALQYEGQLADFAEHGVVNHSVKEYVKFGTDICPTGLIPDILNRADG